MKKIQILFTAFLMIASYTLTAQVAISNDGSSADGSAMLEVKSTTGGLLLPRLTNKQRDEIDSPAEGLFIYYLKSARHQMTLQDKTLCINNIHSA